MYRIDHSEIHGFFDLSTLGEVLAALPTYADADTVRSIHASGGAWQRAVGASGGVVAKAALMWARPGESYAHGVKRWRAAQAAKWATREAA